MEPENKDSFEWKDWFIRHRFGPVVAISIKSASEDELNTLIDFIKEIRKERLK